MTDYERDYTVRLERRLLATEHDRDGWMLSARYGWASAIIIAVALVVVTIAEAVCK